MYVYSEKLNKRFPTVEACEKAEADFDRQVAKEQARREVLSKEKAARKEEIDNKIDELSSLISKYIMDYGRFESNKELPSYAAFVDRLFDRFFN